MSISHDSERNAVITGIGVVSPIGIGVDPFWESLASGRSGVGHIEIFAATAAPHQVGAEIKDFTLETARKQYLKEHRKSLKLMCREIQLGVASASLALAHSGLDLGQIDHERLGVEFGANLMLSAPDQLSDAVTAALDATTNPAHFDYERWGTDGMESMEPLWLLRYLPNMPGCHIGIHADARGPNNSLTLEEASGGIALGEARRIIGRDAADRMLVGTTGTTLHPIKTLHQSLWGGLADSPEAPETWCRPFDLNRTGRVVGEGACTVLVEAESLALERGATIYGRVLGAGSSCVIDRSGRPNGRQALVNAMRAALHDAGLDIEAIGHINAHGLATKETDVEEAQAIAEVFGPRSSEIPVTAVKSFLGNSGAGCGILELAASLLGLRHGLIPQTLNYETPDPECPLNVVAGQPQPSSDPVVLKLNLTRMGQASALLIEAPAA